MAAERAPGRTYPPGSVHPRRPGAPAGPGAGPSAAGTPGRRAGAGFSRGFEMPGRSRLLHWLEGRRGRWNSREGRP